MKGHEEKIENIISEYLEGSSIRTLSTKFQIDRSKLASLLRSNGISIRKAHDKTHYESRRVHTPHTLSCVDSTGYSLVSSYEISTTREHRYIMEQVMGRKLLSKEHVRHIDMDKTNNDPSNLFLFPSGRIHHQYHKYLKSNEHISPQSFMDNYYEQIEWLYSYDTLYDLYITKGMSCNAISKRYSALASRQSIVNNLKKLGIYELRPPSVNQHEEDV